MEIEVRHLKLVRAVSARGGLTAAGRELHLTQSALSHQLRDVEARLGTALFLRVGKRMVLTLAGERLLRSADEVLDTLERTEDAIKALAGAGQGRLRVSMGGYTEYHWLPPVLKALRAAWPLVDLQVIAGVGGDPLDLLVDGTIDVCLIDHRIEDARVLIRPLFDDEVVVIMEPRHPLASKRWVEPEDFSGQTLIVDAPLKGRRVTPAGTTPGSVQVVGQTGAIIELVKAGLGIAVIARWAIEPLVAVGAIRALPLTRKGMHQSWSAAVLKNQADLPHVQSFIDLVVQTGFGASPRSVRRPA